METQRDTPLSNTDRPRCRELGIMPGRLKPGPLNALTDVDGVSVGHTTLVKGEGPLKIGDGPVRTGVTAILPHSGNMIHEPVEAAAYVFNGAGTTTGLSLIEEFGQIHTPICLTNTLSVGAVYDAVARYVTEHWVKGPDDRSWFSPVVGETDDSYLSDMHGFHVQKEHVWRAIEGASPDNISEGVVGAGTGVSTCSFKSGIGTASRIVEAADLTFTVGALVQSNFLGSLVVDGVPVGRDIAATRQGSSPRNEGSLMAIIATDCPLDSRQLKRVAVRGALGMGRTGAQGGHSSGDYFIAFSTSYRAGVKARERSYYSSVLIREEAHLTPLLVAAAEAVEEAILNSIFRAVTVVGRDGNTSQALDMNEMLLIFRRHGRLV